MLTGSFGCNFQISYHGRNPKSKKVTFAILFSFEATCCEIAIVFGITVLKQSLSIVLGFPMNSESSTVDIYPDLPLHQPNQNETAASAFCFSIQLGTSLNDNWQYAELSGTTLNQCSGTNGIKILQIFLATRQEALLCLSVLFSSYDSIAMRKCVVNSVLLPQAPQVSYLVDDLSHVVLRTPTVQLKIDTTTTPESSPTMRCPTSLKRPFHFTKLTFNHGAINNLKSSFHPKFGFLW